MASNESEFVSVVVWSANRKLNTIHISLGHESLDVTLAYLAPSASSLSTWFYRPALESSARHRVITTHRASGQRPAGQRSSMAFMISSAQRTASAIALTVAGTRLPPSNCASLRAARMLAAINSTRLRPSSTRISLSFRVLFA